MTIISLYKAVMGFAKPIASYILQRRLKNGKEDPMRVLEKQGAASLPRPDGRLFWLHAASVGEAQSALILIDALLKQTPDLHILVTTVTRTSAELMKEKLPPRAFHQYAPLDIPDWINRFLNHWKPDAALWMESELWPTCIEAIGSRNIPLSLVNARLSPKSFKTWSRIKPLISHMLKHFDSILCQTQQEANYFEALGGENVIVTGNLKYSAAPLNANEDDLTILKNAIGKRPVWLYASTHAGEEELASSLHASLKESIPDLLSIVVPRHPERGVIITEVCSKLVEKVTRRTDKKQLPEPDTDLYIADTLGELGLFYRLSPIACIGRSFSNDGGGGHNPLEPALLNCAVLHGPHTQNLQNIFDDMNAAGTAIKVSNEKEFAETLRRFLNDPAALQEQQTKTLEFAKTKTDVLQKVLENLPSSIYSSQEAA